MGIEIKVNVYNRLRKIRNGVVYGTVESAVGELIQNCQRSLSKSNKEDKIIDVSLIDNTLIVRDNGIGCSDPQTIFEFEKSGWGIDEAFGQGGSESIFQIADKFQITSNDWTVKCDVEEVLETENMKLDKKELDYTYEGYEVIIEGNFIKDNLYMIYDYLKDLLSHLEYKCILNGEEIKYKDIQELETEYPIIKVENELYSATFTLDKSYRDSNVFYEKRKVCNEYREGIRGNIELKYESVDLKAPDRQSIIVNKKYCDFRDQILKDREELYKFAVTQMDEVDLDNFSHLIAGILKPQDYMNLLSYAGIDSKLTEQIKTNNNEEETEKEEQTNDDGGYFYQEEKEVLVDRVIEEKTQSIVALKTEEKEIEEQKEQNKREQERLRKTRRDTVLNKVNSVWVCKGEVEEYREKIIQLESYGVKVYIARNRLYEAVFEYINRPHISKFITKADEEIIFVPPSNIRKTEKGLAKEERILNVLKYIEEHYDIGDTFEIRPITTKIKLGNVETNEIETDLAVDKEKRKIIINPKSLSIETFDFGDIEETEYPNVIKYDVMVVMANSHIISGGLSTLMYGTIKDTLDHFKRTKEITKEVGIILSKII